MLEITDALLASPVPAMALTVNNQDVDQFDKLVELQGRAGPHMMIGLCQVTPRILLPLGDQVIPFLLLNHCGATQLAQCKAALSTETIIVPTSKSWAEAVATHKAGYCWQQIAATNLANKMSQAAPPSLSNLNWCLDATTHPFDWLSKNIPQLSKWPINTLIVSQAVVAGSHPDMADIISKARRLQRRWRTKDAHTH